LVKPEFINRKQIAEQYEALSNHNALSICNPTTAFFLSFFLSWVKHFS